MIFFRRVHTAAKISCYIRRVRPHGTTAAVMKIAIFCFETSGTAVYCSLMPFNADGWPCIGSGVQSPASRREGPGSIPRQSM